MFRDAVRAVRAVRCFVQRTARGARGARGVCGAVFRDTGKCVCFEPAKLRKYVSVLCA